jgi:hypothetical protein
MDDLKSAHYWRKRAAQTRWTADRAQDQALKQTMLRVAMTYDRLAGARAGEAGRGTLRLVWSNN